MEKPIVYVRLRIDCDVQLECERAPQGGWAITSMQDLTVGDQEELCKALLAFLPQSLRLLSGGSLRISKRRQPRPRAYSLPSAQKCVDGEFVFDLDP